MKSPYTNPPMWSTTYHPQRRILRLANTAGTVHYIPSDKIDCISEGSTVEWTYIYVGNNCYHFAIPVKKVAKLLGWEQDSE